MKKSEARREDILSAATELFFEKGYDATTVRMIMRAVGCEIGLFYYYFESKDALFGQVLDRFFEQYKAAFAQIAASAARDPYRAMTRFFAYLMTETENFRRDYPQTLHRTIIWSIREHTTTLIEPYLQTILEALIAHGAKPQFRIETLSAMLARVVGSFILRESSHRMSELGPEIKKAVHLLMGLDLKTAELMFPLCAQPDDLDAVLSAARACRESFPCFDEAALERTLRACIGRGEAFVIRHEGRTVGCIAFSTADRTLDLLITDKDYLHHGVATRLLVTAMAQFQPGEQWSVVVPKPGNPAGADALHLFYKFGFAAQEEADEALRMTAVIV